MRRSFAALGLLIVYGLGGLNAASAHAEPINIYINQKQDDKEKSRWTLAGWLDTRDKMRVMDMWLALHSPSPYEYYIGGQYDLGSFNPGGSFTGGSIYAAAYATVFGLEVHRDWWASETRTAGIFDLRVWGYHAQSTNLTFQAGVRHQSNALTTYQSALAGATLTLYLAKTFGVQGLYRYYFNSTPQSSGQIFSGNRIEGTAFIEFRFLRIYGTYFTETETPLASRNGFSVGTQLYF